MNPVKGRGNLHQLAQLDGSAEEPRGSHQKRKDQRCLAEEGGKPDQVLLRLEQAQVVGQHAGETQVKLVALDLFAPVQRDGFAIFAHPDQVVAEVGLHLLLLEVQGNLWPADVVRQHTAHTAVQHGHPHHVACNFVVVASHAEAEAAAQRPQNAHKAGQCDGGIEQAHGQRYGGAGELVNVVLDALVRVVGHCAICAGESCQLQLVKSMVVQPALQVLAGHPGAPAHLQQLRQVELVDRHDDAGEGQQGETAQLLPENRLVLVLQGVIEDAVPVVEQDGQVHRAQVERDDGRQQAPRLPAFFGFEVGRRQGNHFADQGANRRETGQEIHGDASSQAESPS